MTSRIFQVFANLGARRENVRPATENSHCRGLLYYRSYIDEEYSSCPRRYYPGSFHIKYTTPVTYIHGNIYHCSSLRLLVCGEMDIITGSPDGSRANQTEVSIISSIYFITHIESPFRLPHHFEEYTSIHCVRSSSSMSRNQLNQDMWATQAYKPSNIREMEVRGRPSEHG